MPEFRKWILALAVVALFVGFASAQVGTPTGGGSVGAFTCSTTNGSVTPTLRAEGYTELVGDIVIICQGGAPPAIGTVVPTANFTVFLSQPVTSRLINNATTSNASEALLIVDEPGSQEPGFGPTIPQTNCSTTLGPSQGAGVNGCVESVGTLNTSGGTVSGVPVAGVGGSLVPGTPGANIFQGLVSGNQVVFNGIPVLPPTSAGDTRVYRITNIRANANGASAGGALGSITASISINSSTSLLLNNSFLTVGYVTPGLTASLGKSGNGSSVPTTLAQCSSASITSSSSASGLQGALALLTFQENFATAFKIRGSTVAPNNQNVPGSIFNSESGFTDTLITGSTGSGTTTIAGLADYGTRLKATFTNVPSGVTLYVSTKDVVNDFSSNNAASYPNGQAVLVLGETAVDTGFTVAGTGNTGASIGVASTQTTTYGSTAIGIAPVAVNPATNSGEAVWEVINTNPAAIDTINFGLFVSYTAAAATNSPAPGTMSVTFSYAPTPSGVGVGFTATTGSEASNLAPTAYTIPRFSDALDITKTVATIAPCTSAMLFPYVINVNGFDTGIAIANTTSDPFSTAAQAGTCSYYFYGSSAPTVNPFITPSIATGTDYANLASVLAPGFSGYMIANCNFQYAHGFAFVSDVGARNLAMGYLALIFYSTTILTRTGISGSEQLNN
jgi:hypothetical protein